MLSIEEVQHIATLCRISVTPDDLKQFRDQLTHIIEEFQILNGANTDQIEPTGHAISIDSVTRTDVAKCSQSSEDTLSNAPRKKEGFIKINSVLDY